MKIKIGKRIFDVEFTNKIDEEDCWGKVIHTEKVIKIKRIDDIEEKVTMLHEIIHALLFSLGYSDQDEVLVHGLAEKFHELIVDNKELFDYLQGKKNPFKLVKKK